jgi:serine phosphatase RsbU (regulator of sigma subunit)
VRRVARAIAGFAHDRFVTLLCARISAAQGTLEYVNAGHLGGAVYARGDRVCPLGPTGPIVSPALAWARWEQASVPWKPESLAVLYTDGIPETYHAGALFGVEGVDRVVAGCGARHDTVVPALVAAVEAFAEAKAAADDRTVLGVWGR